MWWKCDLGSQKELQILLKLSKMSNHRCVCVIPPSIFLHVCLIEGNSAVAVMFLKGEWPPSCGCPTSCSNILQPKSWSCFPGEQGQNIAVNSGNNRNAALFTICSSSGRKPEQVEPTLPPSSTILHGCVHQAQSCISTEGWRDEL